MNQHTEIQSARENAVMPILPTKSDVRLEYDQVSRLLNSLEHVNSSSQRDLEIEQLRAALDDACWLAQWKREYVSLDDEKISIPQLNEMLLSDQKGYH